MTMANQVYAVFVVYGEGYGYTAFDLIGLATSETAARQVVQDHLDKISQRGKIEFSPVHPSMNQENNFTFFGSRNDPQGKSYLSWSKLGGFVVEKMETVSTADTSPSNVEPVLRKFTVAVSWQEYGEIEVEARSLEAAIAKVDADGELPSDHEYVDGSFEINHEVSYEINCLPMPEDSES